MSQVAALPLPAAPVSTASGDPYDDGANQFSPYKILNYWDRVQKLLRGERCYPITVEIDPTNLCNHACGWCVSLEAHSNRRIDFPILRERVVEMASLGVQSIVLKGGGEPTIYPEIVPLIRAIARAGLRVGLITNGSWADPAIDEAVLECVDWVRVSLDAATPETHELIHRSRDFDRILANTRSLAERAGRTTVGTNFCIHRENYREILDMGLLARDLGARYASFRTALVRNDRLEMEIVDEMERQAALVRDLQGERFKVFLCNFSRDDLLQTVEPRFKFPRCLGPNLVGVLGGDGKVYACCFLRGHAAFAMGDVGKQTFQEIWDGDRRREVMERAEQGDCGRVCLGGTTRMRYDYYNELLNYLADERKLHKEFV
ncbi:MAG: radical SAM protein [Planctomycetes bacterium]|nr:radical SAM protein [Planctomycetota bacterium]